MTRSCATGAKVLAERYPRYGFPTLHHMLKCEGQVVNRNRTYRLYREEGLRVRTQRRRKSMRPRIPMLVPDSVNQRRSLDFISDPVTKGRRFRILDVVDDYSRRFVLQIVDLSISHIKRGSGPGVRSAAYTRAATGFNSFALLAFSPAPIRQ